MAKILLMCLVLACPLLVGFFFEDGKQTVRWATMSRAYLYGQFTMWAIFQILAVPMIWLKTSFTMLWISFAVLTAALAFLGGTRMFHARKDFTVSLPRSPVIWFLILATVGMIGFQAYHYIFGMHIDQDDARYIAEANDALYFDRMLLVQPETGRYVGDFSGIPIRDAISPWPLYIAALSAVTTIRPVIMAHTVYAPILLCLSYLVYGLIGAKLFKGKSERIIFLFLIAVIHLFFSGPAIVEGAPAVHTLTRIWQGKAIVEAVAMPAILWQLLVIQEKDTDKNWFLLAVLSCAACLMSGLGMILSLALIGIYGVYIVCCKRFRRLPWLLVSVLPAAVFTVIYILVK